MSESGKIDRAAAEDLLREGRFRRSREPLAALLAAASAPAPADRELPGEADALAAFRAARAAAPPRRRRSALRDALSRVLTAKIATFGLVAVAGVGGVALATVAAPLPGGTEARERPAPARSQTTRPLPSTTGPGVTAGPPVAPATATPSTAAPSRSAPATGRRAPDRDAAGDGQLCRELTGMDDRQRDRALRDARYRDLVRDAGGADRVDRFCDGRRDGWTPSSPWPSHSGRPRDGGQDSYPGGEPSTPPSVSPAPKPPPRG
ncbi:hypothetical protein [Catenuloplanes atrovinosus]|uniref:Uncharacterized protein n=1 Tax=Catenuloplanes atrovinosus TaxID=137266 RepID=A0AAE3YTY4_9ACTN|nr:hypothetical protein [Catenuloplanes atrovinosus]MDR7278334.1 hypothetical protein [Catenuloplanes atrovinosus]